MTDIPYPRKEQPEKTESRKINLNLFADIPCHRKEKPEETEAKNNNLKLILFKIILIIDILYPRKEQP